MNKLKSKFTTIYVNDKIYNELMIFKHNLENKTKQNWSWSKTIKEILNRYKEN